MDILEETGSKRHQPLMADGRTLLSSLELKEINSIRGENIPKVRKPYTITKQRERWTEEEHNKFLEALQLYGRGWRRIEEHIGTKSSVQIRSHAQKFFSKVARESTNNNDRSEILKTIEIPPPRPKRKPSHPYPRKFGNSPNQNIPLFKQSGLQSSFTPSMSEQGEGSPTSVLSTVGSDDPSTSVFQSFKDAFSSPVKSASGSNSQFNGSQSPVSTIQGVNMPQSPFLANRDKHMESYNLPGEKMTSQEASSAEVATIRLFGKTLPLIDPKRSSSSDMPYIEQDTEAPCPIKDDYSQNISRATGQQLPMSLTMQRCNSVPCSSNNMVGNLWNSYSGGSPLPHYYFDLHGDSSTNTATSHLPWRQLSQTWSSAVTNPQTTSPRTYPPLFGLEAISGNETQREGSWTGSSTTYHNGAAIGAYNVDGVDSKESGKLQENEPQCTKLKPADTSAFRSWNLGLDDPRNYFPRKRCAAESEAQSIAAIEDEENLTIRLCL